MNGSSNSQKMRDGTTHILALTANDTKILGKFNKQREETLPPTKFQTRLFKTYNSNWTPLVHKPSNDQVYSALVHFYVLCNLT